MTGPALQHPGEEVVALDDHLGAVAVGSGDGAHRRGRWGTASPAPTGSPRRCRPGRASSGDLGGPSTGLITSPRRRITDPRLSSGAVVDEHPQAHTHLVGGQTDTVCGVHRLVHVVEQCDDPSGRAALVVEHDGCGSACRTGSPMMVIGRIAMCSFLS